MEVTNSGKNGSGKCRDAFAGEASGRRRGRRGWGPGRAHRGGAEQGNGPWGSV